MKQLIYIFLLCLPLASCIKNQPVQMAAEVLHASLESTKVQILGLGAVWNTGDTVSVFHHTEVNEKWSYQGQDKAPSGILQYHSHPFRQFTHERIIAIYPFDRKTTLKNDVLTTTVPPQQTYSSDGHTSSLMYSQTEDDNLYFQYATSQLGLRLNGRSTISSITVEGLNDEVIAGEYRLDFTTEIPSFCLKGGEKSVTMKAVQGDICISGNETICFAIAPVTFEKGYKFTIEHSDGRIQECKSTAPAEMKAGHIRIINCKVADTKTISLVFSKDGNRQSPIDFNCNGIPGYGFTNLITGDVIGPFHMFEDKEQIYPFHMYIRSKYKSDDPAALNPDAFRITDGGGLKFGGHASDWMQIPAMEGYSLRQVKVLSGNKAPTCITTALEGEENNIINGGEEQTSGFMSFYLRETQPNTPYRYTLTDVTPSSILSISFIYEKSQTTDF